MFTKKTHCYTDSCTDRGLVFKADTERILATNIKRHKKRSLFCIQRFVFLSTFLRFNRRI